MIDLDIRPECDPVPRKTYIADSPIDFASWLEIAQELDTELVRGVIVERMSAQYPHEWIFAWLLSILRPFVTHRKLGVVLGSRSAVKISGNDGRLPDILFVRAENASIIHNEAIYGVPDLVIEIVSENDRPSTLIPLETDYRDLGVPEIVFIDPRKRGIRYLRKTEKDYEAAFLTTGRLAFVGVPGFWIEVEWLFAEEKPDEFTITKQLIEAAEKT
ncbi:MAG TPA: Uma2 family endonuclease [Chthonomonadaceae bacterium]|nr:Uma2 family endonuclease [Chthonomonadaceae bacterium]